MIHWQYCGDPAAENGGMAAKVNVMLAIVNFWWRSRAKVRKAGCGQRLCARGDASLIVDLGLRPPVHGHETGGLFDPS
jgi:hypothetical protein